MARILPCIHLGEKIRKHKCCGKRNNIDVYSCELFKECIIFGPFVKFSEISEAQCVGCEKYEANANGKEITIKPFPPAKPANPPKPDAPNTTPLRPADQPINKPAKPH